MIRQGMVRKPVREDSAIAGKVIDLRAEGLAIGQIAAALRVGRDRVERVLEGSAFGLMPAGDVTDNFRTACASRRLLAAIRRHHPERCGEAA